MAIYLMAWGAVGLYRNKLVLIGGRRGPTVALHDGPAWLMVAALLAAPQCCYPLSSTATIAVPTRRAIECSDGSYFLELILQRNAVVHRVWEADFLSPQIRSESIAIGDVQVRAREAASVAHNLRNARMLLLHLLLDHYPSAAMRRDRRKSDLRRLKVQLGL